ncbi:MAG: hypothetical protein IKN43_06530 [Selenomonadaceae bacterium]|nr:hypothetical protein [Selenomonadaceae bacterium]
MKIVAFLPAKGSSERIENKNMKVLNGKPLFLHTLEKLTACDFIDEVYLDSESDEILNYAPYLDYVPLKRNPDLASNRTDGHQLFYNEVRQVDADIYIQILCTSPFISPNTIKKGIDILHENKEYDSVILVKKEKQYLWENGQPIYDKFHIPNSSTLPDTILESMGLYIVRGKEARSLKMRYGNNVYMLTADAIETVDVNFPDEFTLAERIMRGVEEQENGKRRMISKFLNSAILSDILNDMGIVSTISGLIPNLPGKKIFARANTLKIGCIKNGEDYRGIYDGLSTYERITPGEVIVVENEIPDRAYFGNLNAHLAIRAGAVGTIVSGVTRDIDSVCDLDYPVFATGYSCIDVKGHAIVTGHQVPIKIQGVDIFPGDLIFADRCGIVRIPRKYEIEVLKKVFKVINKEHSVLQGVLAGDNARDIYLREGEF